jgi:hypothetical protein
MNGRRKEVATRVPTTRAMLRDNMRVLLPLIKTRCMMDDRLHRGSNLRVVAHRTLQPVHATRPES